MRENRKRSCKSTYIDMLALLSRTLSTNNDSFIMRARASGIFKTYRKTRWVLYTPSLGGDSAASRRGSREREREREKSSIPYTYTYIGIYKRVKKRQPPEIKRETKEESAGRNPGTFTTTRCVQANIVARACKA